MRKNNLRLTMLDIREFFLKGLLCSFFLTIPLLIAYSIPLPVNGENTQDASKINGSVLDADSKVPLPGVNVIIKESNVGTITDLDGKFHLEVENPNVTLIFSFMGYQSVEIPLEGQTELEVLLKEDTKLLDEVIVIGYGTQKKSDLTGSVASVAGEKIAEMPTLSVDQALQGRASGVSITSNTGMPGGDVQIQIRGISSVNGSEPLVIVDGVRSSLSNLNPLDVESIEILKDASSAAIYGATGGNGVILVTTKKGKIGKIQTNLNIYKGWQRPWKEMDMLNLQEYIEQRNYDNAVKGRPPFSTQPDTFQHYNWQDEMLRTALTDQYDLSIQGGNDYSTYFFSANYTRQNGILKNSDYERFGFRINSDHNISKYIKIGENAQFTKVKRVGYDEWYFQNEYNSPLIPILKMDPYLSPYDENGDWTLVPSGVNPIVDQDVMDRTKQEYSFGGNAYIDITPIKGLTITSRVNAYTNFNINDEFIPLYEYSPQQGTQWNTISKEMAQQYGWQIQTFGNYNTTFFESVNLGLMAGYESEYSKYGNMQGERRNYLTEVEENRYLSSSTNDTLAAQIVEGTGWEDAGYSYFGRINADYIGKYLVTFNFRKDYSSRFGPNYRSGVFPSFSVGWKFSEESFMNQLSFINFGKIRFGYGQTGANAPERYRYYAVVDPTNDTYRYIFDNSINPRSGAAFIQVPNFDMHWETMVMSNIGIDLGFLENKFIATIDLFRKYNKDMLIYKSLPANAGYYQYREHTAQLGGDSRPLVNIGKILNEGIELALGYKLSAGDVNASFDVNTTFLRNEVKNLEGDSIYEATATVGVNLKNITLTCEDFPVSQFNGYETDGLFTWDDALINSEGDIIIWNQPYSIRANGDTSYAQQFAQPGDLRFVDQNNDGKLNADDRVNIGSPIPKIILGFSTNISYKNIDLNIFLEGKFGHKLFNGSKMYLMEPSEFGNKGKLVLDQYRDEINDMNGNLIPGNTNTSIPRSFTSNYSTVSDFYVESGNYLRLKNIQLGYTIPKVYTQKVGIDKLRIYAGVKNALTFTKYTGFDPEIGSSNMQAQGIDKAAGYPHSRVLLFGANLQF
ncbi:SusC/RagA family TonB-linked outer membrane protein [Bacteroidota bacterium]